MVSRTSLVPAVSVVTFNVQPSLLTGNVIIPQGPDRAKSQEAESLIRQNAGSRTSAENQLVDMEPSLRPHLATLRWQREARQSPESTHPLLAKWGRRDLNSHGSLHVILNHARLPVPTLPQRAQEPGPQPGGPCPMPCARSQSQGLFLTQVKSKPAWSPNPMSRPGLEPGTN